MKLSQEQRIQLLSFGLRHPKIASAVVSILKGANIDPLEELAIKRMASALAKEGDPDKLKRDTILRIRRIERPEKATALEVASNKLHSTLSYLQNIARNLRHERAMKQMEEYLPEIRKQPRKGILSRIFKRGTQELFEYDEEHMRPFLEAFYRKIGESLLRGGIEGLRRDMISEARKIKVLRHLEYMVVGFGQLKRILSSIQKRALKRSQALS